MTEGILRVDPNAPYGSKGTRMKAFLKCNNSKYHSILNEDKYKIFEENLDHVKLKISPEITSSGRRFLFITTKPGNAQFAISVNNNAFDEYSNMEKLKEGGLIPLGSLANISSKILSKVGPIASKIAPKVIPPAKKAIELVINFLSPILGQFVADKIAQKGEGLAWLPTKTGKSILKYIPNPARMTLPAFNFLLEKLQKIDAKELPDDEIIAKLIKIAPLIPQTKKEKLEEDSTKKI